MLAAMLVLSLLATALMAASKNWTGAGLGDLSQYYETGNSANPGRISTVPGDPGGKSYGIYMFASKAGTPLSFIKWLQEFKEGSIYRDMGDTLYNAYAYNQAGKYSPGYGSNFDATWERVAESYTSEFTQSQKDFWETHAYADLLANIKSAVPSFDIADYSLALRNVFWSRSVHHGAGVIRGANSSDGRSGATGVILRAFDALGGFKTRVRRRSFRPSTPSAASWTNPPPPIWKDGCSAAQQGSTASPARRWPTSSAAPAMCSSASTPACTSMNRRTPL